MTNDQSSHVIRLRGPWRLTPLEQPDAKPVTGSIGVPCSSSLGDYRGKVRYERNFNQPSGLNEQSRLELSISQFVGDGHLEVNGRWVGNLVAAESPVRFDITEYLAPSNTVLLELVSDDSQSVGLTGDVRLKIYD